MFHISLIGFFVGLEVSLSIDSFQGRSRMDEECLAHTGVPGRNLQFHTVTNLHLEMVVLEGRDRGWIEFYLVLDTHFLLEKKIVGHNTKYRNVTEKTSWGLWQDQICQCGAFPFRRWGHLHPTSPMAYTIVWHHTEISPIAFVQTFLSCLGRSGWSVFAEKANPAKKKILELFIMSWAGNRQHQEQNVLVSTLLAPAWQIQG
jgi:hypothetical protein